MSLVRLRRELQIWIENPSELFSGGPVNGNLYHWQATIIGPPSSPYAGGKFRLAIDFPPAYPFQPPQVVFKTHIYHPNIFRDGTINLDILRPAAWAAAITISGVLMSICSLMCDPHPNDPFKTEVARIFDTDRERFNELAREWTQKEAM